MGPAMCRAFLLLAATAAVVLLAARQPSPYRQELAPERKQAVDAAYPPIFSPPAVQVPSHAPLFDASAISADAAAPAISGTLFQYEHQGDARSPARSEKPLPPSPNEAPAAEMSLCDYLKIAAFVIATFVCIAFGCHLYKRLSEPRARSKVHPQEAEMN